MQTPAKVRRRQGKETRRVFHHVIEVNECRGDVVVRHLAVILLVQCPVHRTRRNLSHTDHDRDRIAAQQVCSSPRPNNVPTDRWTDHRPYNESKINNRENSAVLSPAEAEGKYKQGMCIPIIISSITIQANNGLTGQLFCMLAKPTKGRSWHLRMEITRINT